MAQPPAGAGDQPHCPMEDGWKCRGAVKKR